MQNTETNRIENKEQLNEDFEQENETQNKL